MRSIIRLAVRRSGNSADAHEVRFGEVASNESFTLKEIFAHRHATHGAAHIRRCPTMATKSMNDRGNDFVLTECCQPSLAATLILIRVGHCHVTNQGGLRFSGL